jgi:8-oxo-dGTP diphosphatase
MIDAVRVVAVALINSKNEILVAQRAPHESFAGQWEFPGGKVEAGESSESALQREMLEELGFQVPLGQSLGCYRHSYGTFVVEIEVFIGHYADQVFRLVDHSQVCWLSIDELETWPLAAADEPFVGRIRQALRTT